MCWAHLRQCVRPALLEAFSPRGSFYLWGFAVQSGASLNFRVYATTRRLKAAVSAPPQAWSPGLDGSRDPSWGGDHSSVGSPSAVSGEGGGSRARRNLLFSANFGVSSSTDSSSSAGTYQGRQPTGCRGPTNHPQPGAVPLPGAACEFWRLGGPGASMFGQQI